MWDINLFSAKRGLIVSLFLLASLLIVTDVYAAHISMTLRPNADGTNNQWLIGGSSPAPSRWESVDESTADEDVTYVYVGSANQKQDFNIENNVYGAGTISSVTVWIRARYAPGAERMLICVVSGATTACSGNINPTTSYVDYSNAWTTDPADSSAWTWTDIDALQAEVQSKARGPWSGTAELRVTQVWIVVDYDPVLDSYSSSGCTSQSDGFDSGSTAYICGNGYTPSTNYDIAVYDNSGPPNDDRVCLISSITSDANGQLDGSCTLSGVVGDWHSQVFAVGGSPATYSSKDTGIIAEDLTACTGSCAFDVLAVPEFGLVMFPLVTSCMIYLFIKRRFSRKRPSGLT